MSRFRNVCQNVWPVYGLAFVLTYVGLISSDGSSFALDNAGENNHHSTYTITSASYPAPGSGAPIKPGRLVAAGKSSGAAPRAGAKIRKPEGKSVTFGFQIGDLYKEYGAREVSPAEDEAYWNQRTTGGKTEAEEQIAEEEKTYIGIVSGVLLGPSDTVRLRRLPPDWDVYGYGIGTNNPTYRQNCAGLSLERLLQGRYNFPPESAYELLEKEGFGKRRENLDDLDRGDLVLYQNKEGTPKHVAIYDGGRTVISKDNAETVRSGDVDQFSKVKHSSYSIESKTYFHLEWKKIKVYRKHPVVITVESVDTKKPVEGALVELMASEPVGKPPEYEWDSKRTDAQGKASFTVKPFPFDLNSHNLIVVVNAGGYAITRTEEPFGPRQFDWPCTITVSLKREPLRQILGKWRQEKFGDFEISGEDGSISAKVVERTKRMEEGMIPNGATWFTKGKVTSFSPVVVESNNYWSYPWGPQCSGMEPHKTGHIRLTLSPGKTSADDKLEVVDEGPNYWINDCQWVKDGEFHAATHTWFRVPQGR